MKSGWIAATALASLLAGCAAPGGSDFNPVDSGIPGAGPQSTRATFEMTGLEPFPRYAFSTNGRNSPADALVAGGGSTLRSADRNLVVEVESRTYLMRQVELDGNIYVVAEGAAPVASMPSAIRARSGCLVQPVPLRSGDAAVYTLDCS